jgi:3-oxoacyl-(acyl-carrier-protein) synthase
MGKADVVLAGGADALGEALVRGLGDMGLLKTRAGALPFGDRLAGVYPAEGAAVVVLERHDRARRRGARCWARIDGYAAGFEPTLTHHDRQCTGVVETMRRALALSGHAAGDVDLVMTSAHATAVDDTERTALCTVLADAHSPLLFAPKAAWGETFGADGALSVALASALLDAPQPVADNVARDLHGSPVSAGAARARLQDAQLALVHSLCYSGATVTLVLARAE